MKNKHISFGTFFVFGFAWFCLVGWCLNFSINAIVIGMLLYISMEEGPKERREPKPTPKQQQAKKEEEIARIQYYQSLAQQEKAKEDLERRKAQYWQQRYGTASFYLNLCNARNEKPTVYGYYQMNPGFIGDLLSLSLQEIYSLGITDQQIIELQKMYQDYISMMSRKFETNRYYQDSLGRVYPQFYTWLFQGPVMSINRMYEEVAKEQF